MNVFLDVYESGVPQKIKNDGNKNIIINCHRGSRAIEYARKNNLQIANADA
jgi:3-deoxy-D-arabino-heptulosonate 7-phosphate (DAHP) synthase